MGASQRAIHPVFYRNVGTVFLLRNACHLGIISCFLHTTNQSGARLGQRQSPLSLRLVHHVRLCCVYPRRMDSRQIPRAKEIGPCRWNTSGRRTWYSLLAGNVVILYGIESDSSRRWDVKTEYLDYGRRSV